MASTVLGIVGGVVGSFFGCPQLGFMLGSMLGSLLDPQRIQGPRITDAQQQTSSVGGPIPVIWGRPQPIGGNLIWCDDYVEHESDKSAKGGPTQVTYTYTRSYAIGFGAPPPSAAGAGVSRLTRLWKNNKLVYDATASASTETQAAMQKLQNVLTIYLGSEAQMPDPTMEAVLGVGNVPAHRGMFYIVLKDDDVTDTQTAVAQWRSEWETDSPPAPSNVHAQLYSGRSNPWPDATAAQAMQDPRVSGVEYEYGVNSSGFSLAGVANWRGSLAEALADAKSTLEAAGYALIEPTLRGWANGSTYFWGGNGDGAEYNKKFAPWDSDPDSYAGLPDLTNYTALGLVFSRVPSGVEEFVFHGGSGGVGYPTCDTGAMRGGVWARTFDTGGSLGGGSKVYAYGAPPEWMPDQNGSHVDIENPCSEGGLFYEQYSDFIIAVRPKFSCLEGVDPTWSPIPDADGFYVDLEGTVHSIGNECGPSGGAYLQLAPANPAQPSNNEAVFQYPVGPAMLTTDPDNNPTFWTDAYNDAVTAGLVPAGWTYGVEYPTGTSVGVCVCPLPAPLSEGVPLSRIVGDLCTLSKLDASMVDVAELDAVTVIGFLVGSFTGATDAILPLMAGFGFDAGEWDKKLRFKLRGAASVREFTDESDFLEDDNGPIKTTLQQDLELPRKLTVQYFEPGSDGNTATQTSERNTSDTRAVGEQIVQIPVVMDTNHAKQRAVILQKTMFTEAQGDEEFALTDQHTDLTTTDCIDVPVDGRSVRVRIDKIDNDDGSMNVTGKRDRISAHFSNAIGASPVPTNPVVGGLVSPTRIVVMQLAQLRSQDNSPGVYVAACGLLAGWDGCAVMVSTDGGLTYNTALSIRNASTMGYLTSDQAMADTTMDVKLLAGQLSSATTDQVAVGVNAYAVTTGGVSEVGTFETETPTGAKAYTLSDLNRPLNGTVTADHATDDPFVMLDTAYFLPLDPRFAGKTIYLKGVTVGASVSSGTVTTFVYEPPTYIIDGGEVTT